MNQAIHMIDMLLWMVGVPNEVYGRWATLKHGEYIDVEDTACATVGFENGAMASIVATTTLKSIEKAQGFRLAVHGAKGHTLGFPSGRSLRRRSRISGRSTLRIRSTHGRRPRAANLDSRASTRTNCAISRVRSSRTASL